MHLDGEVATGSEVPAFQLMDEFLNLMLDPFVDGRLGNGAYGSGARLDLRPMRKPSCRRMWRWLMPAC